MTHLVPLGAAERTTISKLRSVIAFHSYQFPFRGNGSAAMRAAEKRNLSSLLPNYSTNQPTRSQQQHVKLRSTRSKTVTIGPNKRSVSLVPAGVFAAGWHLNCDTAARPPVCFPIGKTGLAGRHLRWLSLIFLVHRRPCQNSLLLRSGESRSSAVDGYPSTGESLAKTLTDGTGVLPVRPVDWSKKRSITFSNARTPLDALLCSINLQVCPRLFGHGKPQQ
jgi:hypothetical protein